MEFWKKSLAFNIFAAILWFDFEEPAQCETLKKI